MKNEQNFPLSQSQPDLDNELINVNLSKSDYLSILLFLSFHIDQINSNPVFQLVKIATNNLNKSLASSVSDTDFNNFCQDFEIYSFFKKPEP